MLLISNNYYTQIEVLKYQNLKKLTDCNNAALNLSLSRPDKYKNETYTEIRPPVYEDIKTEIKHENWGGYSIVSTRAKWKNLKYRKTSLTGPYLNKEEKVGLYLADLGKYISIAGHTHLSGACYIPALGIRSVYIDGKPYKGSKLINGSEKTSKKQLPQINTDLLEWIKNSYTGQIAPNDSVGEQESLYREQKIEQKFRNKPLIFNCHGEVNLSGIHLSGKIIVRSDSAIILNKTLKASGIIAIAPIIVVEKSFSGNVQLFARDSLLIDEDVNLGYPSFVSVCNPEGSKAFCFISEGASVSGGVLVVSQMEEGKKAELYIEKEADIHGIAYCSGSVSHKGEVYGSLYLNRFILKTKRGYYENHLLDAVVDPDKQYKNIVVPAILSGKTEMGLIDWVE